jgi:hypothetical protein
VSGVVSKSVGEFSVLGAVRWDCHGMLVSFAFSCFGHVLAV